MKTYNCQELGLAKALAKKGHKVIITTPDHKEEHTLVNVEGGEPIEIYKLRVIGSNPVICWHAQIKKVLDEINPEIIHLNGFLSLVCLYYAIWKKKHSCKAVMIEGSYEISRKPIKKILQLFGTYTIGYYVLKQMDGFGCKTQWAGRFVNRFINSEVVHTPIGLDTEKFSLSKEIEWRKKLGLERKKVLLYVGVQEKRRNPDFLIQLMKKLPEEYVLVMVGNGPMLDDINMLTEELDLQSRVMQLGKIPQSELPSLYRSSDLFLLASSYEIYGMVLLESMFFGLPVISTLTAGSDCLIDSGIDGLIIEDLDVDKWGKAVRNICETDLHEQMSVAAEKKIKEHFVWDKTVDEFLKLYSSVINGKG